MISLFSLWRISIGIAVFAMAHATPIYALTGRPTEMDIVVFSEDKPVPDLKFAAPKRIVYRRYKGKTLQRIIYLYGKLERPNWKLFLQGKAIGLSKDGYFKLVVPIESWRTELPVLIVSREGAETPGLVVIKIPNWQTEEPPALAPEAVEPAKPTSGKRYPIFWSNSLGVSDITFQQAGIVDFSEWVTTAKIAAEKALFPDLHISIRANAFATLFAITTSQANTLARFLGANLSLGYDFPFVKSPWRFRIASGVYYLTTYVADDAFGFKNLAFLQVTPNVRWQFHPRRALGLYVKLAPVSLGLFTLNFAQRELAVGLSYEYLVYKSQALFFTLDYSNLKIDLTESINSSSLSFAVGYRL